MVMVMDKFSGFKSNSQSFYPLYLLLYEINAFLLFDMIFTYVTSQSQREGESFESVSTLGTGITEPGVSSVTHNVSLM